MNKGTTQFIAKGIVFLVLVFIALYAIYMLDLARGLFFAAWNTIQLAIVGLVFLAVSWKKLKTIKAFKWGIKSTVGFLVLAVVFLGLRYYFIDSPARSVLTAIGLLALVPAVFSLWCIRALLHGYRKELVIAAVIGAIIVAALYFANAQMYLRQIFGM